MTHIKIKKGGLIKNTVFSLAMGMALVSMLFAAFANQSDVNFATQDESEIYQETQEKLTTRTENKYETQSVLPDTTETHLSQRDTRSGEGEMDIVLKWLDGYGTIIGYLSSIKSADVDNDNETEIVFGNSEGYVYVVSRSDTGFVEEWHTMVAIYAFGLSLGDVDGDGTIEIVVGDSEGYINIFGFNGETYQLEWTSPDLGSNLFGLTTADVDDDGVTEIIAGSSVSDILEDNLFVFAWQGSTYTQEWSFALTFTLGYLGIYNIDVGDVDGDSSTEIVIATFESEMLQNDPPVNPIPPNPRPNGQLGGRFYVFGYTDGSGALEWQSDDFGEWIIGLDISNTDSDFNLEIVITVYLGEVYVFGYNGLVYTTEWQSDGLQAYALTTGWIGNPFYNRIVISSWENICVYEYTIGAYEEVWASPELDSFVYGLGIGDLDDNENVDEILTGTDFRFYVHSYYDHETYVLEAESDNIGAMESICSGDLDDDGTNEVFLGTGNGSVMVMSFNGISMDRKDMISLSTRTITHLAVGDVDDDGEDEIIAVEGHASVVWNENFIFRSAGGEAIVYILGHSGSGYVIENQIYVDTGGTFAVEVGDVDEDNVPEILLGGTGYDEVNEDPFVGRIEVVDFDGTGYSVAWESYYFDNWVMGVAIGDVDDDGLNEIVTEDYDPDSEINLLRLFEWDGATFVESQTIQIESENYALDIGDTDHDGRKEIVSKGIFSGLLEVFGWTGSSYTQEWSNGLFTTFIDECFAATNLKEGKGDLLIFGELGVFIYERAGSIYQEVWHSPEVPASIKTLHVADVDIALGKEIIGSSGGYNFIYGGEGEPIALLNVSDTIVEVGDVVVFDGSSSMGYGELEYFFDFGDGTNTGWVSIPIVNHAYFSADTYIASLKVRDETMAVSDVVSSAITVLLPNQEPKAFIDSISPNPALLGENVTLDGYGNDDKEIIAYSWFSSIDGFLGDTASIGTNQLSPGDHTILFRVQDSDYIWSDEVSGSLRIHERPIATINSISPNPASQNSEVSFVGNASDDGSIIAYEWHSSINGFLSDEASFTSSTLSLGQHEISFKAMDNDGVWSYDAVSYLRINKIPVAIIDSISPSSANEGESVTFTGHGSDDTGIAAYNWRSSIDDFLSNSASFSTSTLSIGKHIIYFKVKDEDGAWSEEVSMGLHINQIPVAHIDSISPNPVLLGELITFEGHGSDDGSITAYNWESDIDGFLSSKSSFSTSGLSPGAHTITFKVRDNKGVWSESDTTTLTAFEALENVIPIAFIDSIEPSQIKEGEYVTFLGHGSDEDGDVTQYNWESDIDGFLSDARSFTTSDLSVGTHLISFSVKDDSGDWSEPAEMTVVVEEAEEEGGGLGFSALSEGPWLLLFILIVILVILLAIIAKLLRKYRRRERYHVQIGGFENLGTKGYQQAQR